MTRNSMKRTWYFKMKFFYIASLLSLCIFRISSTSPLFEGIRCEKNCMFPPSEQNNWPWEDVGQYSLPMYFKEFHHNSEEPTYILKNTQPLSDQTNIHPYYHDASEIDIRVPNRNLNKRAGERDSELNNYKSPEEEDSQITSLHGYRESYIKSNGATARSGSPDTADDACQSCLLEAYNSAPGQNKDIQIWCALLECQRRERLMRIKELIDNQKQVLKDKLNELMKDNSKIKITDGIPPPYDYVEYYGEDDDPYPNYYLYEDLQPYSESNEGYLETLTGVTDDDPSYPTAILYNNGDNFNPSESDTMWATSEENYKYYDISKENYSSGKSKSSKEQNTLHKNNPSQSKSQTNSPEEDYNFYDDPQYVDLSGKPDLSSKSKDKVSYNSSKAIIISPNTAEEDLNFYDDMEFTNMNVKGKNSSGLHNNSSTDQRRNSNWISTDKNFDSYGRGKILPELYEKVTTFPSSPYESRIRKTTKSFPEKLTNTYSDSSPYQSPKTQVNAKQLGLPLQAKQFPFPYFMKKIKNDGGKKLDPKEYVTFEQDLRPTTFLPLSSHDFMAHEPSSDLKNTDFKKDLRKGTESAGYRMSNLITLSTTPLPDILGATVNEGLEKVPPIVSDESRMTSKHFKGITEANKKRTTSSNQNLSKEYFSRFPATSSDGNFNQYEHTPFNYDDKSAAGKIFTTHIRKEIPEGENMVDNSYLGATNTKLSNIPGKNEEGPFPSTALQENKSDPNLSLGNDLITSLERFDKKDILPAIVQFYDKIDKDRKVVKYCLCQCSTEVSPINVNLSESESDDDYKLQNAKKSYLYHNKLSNIFSGNEKSTTLPLYTQLSPFEEEYATHINKQSDTSTSPSEHSFSTFDPNINHLLVVDNVNEFPSNYDRNEKGILAEDMDDVNNVGETKSQFLSKNEKIPYSTSEITSRDISETDSLDYMDRDYDHLIPINFEKFSEYMDSTSMANSKADHDDFENRKVMPEFISKPSGIVELEYDCRDQMFPHRHLGIDSGSNSKQIYPKKKNQLPLTEQMPMGESDKSLPSIYHSFGENLEMKSPEMSTASRKHEFSSKAADGDSMEKHILEDMSKEQNRKILPEEDLQAKRPSTENFNKTSNLKQNKPQFKEDGILSQSQFRTIGEDDSNKNPRKLSNHSEFREEDPNSPESTDDRFPYVHPKDQLHHTTTPKNDLPDAFYMTDKNVPLSLESFMESSQSPEKDHTSSDCPSCSLANRKLDESKLNPMMDSLQKIKKNCMTECDSVPSASDCKSNSCDDACKQHVKDKLKTLISIISWLENSMK